MGTDSTYPLTLTRETIAKAVSRDDDSDFGDSALAAFDAVAPDGVLRIHDVNEHVAILRGPLASYETWAVDEGLLPPIVATAGDHGTATAGYRGTASAGAYGTATAGNRGTALAGHGGVLQIAYFDAAGRRRIATAYVGKDSILADTPYRLDHDVDPPRFVRVEG